MIKEIWKKKLPHETPRDEKQFLKWKLKSLDATEERISEL